MNALGADADLGIDTAAFTSWLDRQGVPGGPLTDLAELGGGTQNVMVRFRRGERGYVLRRPPLHPRARSNDALRREMRVLDALVGTGVPAPRIVAAAPEPGLLGEVVFYVMEEVVGANCSVEIPPAYAADSTLRHKAGLAAARAVATLGEVDPEAVGLSGLGRPDGFLERQVGRWLRELDSYSQLPGYPGPELPGLARLAEWLDRHRPPATAPGLLHGDFHLANLLFAPERPEVAAIVDWEMATVGDPLLDLGWLLATWPGPGERGLMSDSALAVAGGLATREELVDAYREASSRDVSAVVWYRALACFKLGILLEGTHARAWAGKASKETGDRLHRDAVSLFDQASRLI